MPCRENSHIDQICDGVGLKIDEFAREKMDALANELVEEKTLAYSLLH